MVEKIKQALDRAYRERKSPATSLAGILSDARYHEIDTKQMNANRIITFDDTDSNVERFRLLRTRLLKLFEEKNLSSVGISSANSGEGKSLISLNLAISLAKSTDAKVILIDGNLARPSIHERLKLVPESGLGDLLNQEAILEKVIVRVNVPNLWVLPGRYEKGRRLESSSLGRLEILIERLSDNGQNIIIVDLPPVLGKDDTLAFTDYLDSIIMVVEKDVTTSDQVSRAVSLLKKNKLIGCVLNERDRS